MLVESSFHRHGVRQILYKVIECVFLGRSVGTSILWTGYATRKCDALAQIMEPLSLAS
jgi:hypothetical protein